jgi:hypothetical protein
MDATDEIARAVLYEGYLLWPYRHSALKNQQRWTFGGVYPEPFCREQDEGDRWSMRTECLLEAPAEATVQATIRCLHVLRRQPARVVEGELVRVDSLEVGGERHHAWDEAQERELLLPPLSLAALREPYRQEVEIAGGSAVEWLAGAGEESAGALVREWEALSGRVALGTEALSEGLWRVSLTLENTAPWVGGGRVAAQRRTFCSTHAVLRTSGGGFVSLTDPPAEHRAAAEACSNEGVWPVLVGGEGERYTLLCSPMILPDYPRVAPESPGDLFDGGEIDQLLILSILSLTEEEQAEMRATDPKARAILERCATLSSEQLAQLHGAIRDMRPVSIPMG